MLMRHKTLVKRTCLYCNIIFDAELGEVNRGGAKYCSRKCAGKVTSVRMTNEGNHQWKDKPTYRTLHQWVERKLGKPDHCENCGEGKHFQWANISGEYLRDISDWASLCAVCHNAIDDIARKVAARRKVNGTSHLNGRQTDLFLVQ